jgi:hypothetical protein
VSHKVLCADLDRHQVGYVDVQPGKSQVLIENVCGKYRLDIVAFNGAGASAPKQAFFDCSLSQVAQEELERAFADWDRQRAEAADPLLLVRGESKSPEKSKVGLEEGQAVAVKPVGLILQGYGEAPTTPRATGPGRRNARGPFTPQARKPKKEETFFALSASRDVKDRSEGRELVDMKPSPVTAPVTTPSLMVEQFDKETADLRADALAKKLLKTPERSLAPGTPQLKRSVTPPGKRNADMSKFMSLYAPHLPTVKRPKGWLNAMGDAEPLKVVANVVEDACTFKWGWRALKPNVGGFVVFTAVVGEKWQVAGRLQYGEHSYTCRHMARNKDYQCVVWATPVASRGETELSGWLSEVVSFTVHPGVPAAPSNVQLGISADTVTASWEHAKISVSGEPIAGYKVRGADDEQGNPGTLLCEVPATCSSLSWPMQRYQGGPSITVSAVSKHKLESHRVSSKLRVQSGVREGTVQTPTVHVVSDETAAPPAITVSWVKKDTLARYALLVKVRNARRVRRLPVTSSPATCALEPGAEVVVALEADNPTFGPRVSPWSNPVQLPADAPRAPGRPCVRLAKQDVVVTWASPLIVDMKEEVRYIVVVESQDGHRAEINAGTTPFWTVPLNDILDNFQPARLRFAVIAVSSAGRSPQSSWSSKQFFQPSAGWMLKNDTKLPSGRRTGRSPTRR